MSEEPQQQLTEEQLRQIEAEMERITVDDVLIQTTVTLLNLAARKAALGAPPGEGPPPDWEEVHQAIEGARALVPLLEARHAEQLGPVRDTLSRLQMVYAQNAGGARGAETAPPEPSSEGEPGSPEAGASEPPKPGEPGPAQRSGRLWIPGQ